MKEFYYQIKGKKSETQSSLSNWVFPPIFSGKVEAEDKQEAKKLIEEEYGRQFPLRVLSKDLDSNEFLLNIEDMTNNYHAQSLFEKKVCQCEGCNKTFRRIDKYNDLNLEYKNSTYCSDECTKLEAERKRYEVTESQIDNWSNVPVIYKITNKRTNLCYIGQTMQSFTLRWWQHIKWGRTDCKFHNAMKASDITDWTFEVVEIVLDTKLLSIREAYHINLHDSIENGYNSVNVNSQNILEVSKDG